MQFAQTKYMPVSPTRVHWLRDGTLGWKVGRRNKLMLKGIHHAAIICSDYKASKRFYTKILKLEILQRITEQRASLTNLT